MGASTTRAAFDTGGTTGFVPPSLIPSQDVFTDSSGNEWVAQGTTMTVYTSNPSSGGTELYSITAGNEQVPVTLLHLNTGIYPFLGEPVYLAYSPNGTGMLYFDS